ncbi:MAG: C-GCAxxG-C-C family (seleno)protein [Desulfovibrionaceae bacterium]|nr:C-GCAxxG-C-C family (seleno)protein [Desulfovibrionaceae bacterium]
MREAMLNSPTGQGCSGMDSSYPERVKARAEALYLQQGLNCAEAVFKALLEEAGQSCPVEMVRMASAFGKGQGGSGCLCGSLAGGQMAMGYFFGRVEETGKAPELCGKSAKLLHERFVEANRATCCRILSKGLIHGTPEQKKACGVRTAGNAAIAAEIILETLGACHEQAQSCTN